MDEGRLEEIEATAADAWFISEVRPDIAELVTEVRALRGRLQAVCDVLSDAAAYGEDVEPSKVLEAVRGARKARAKEITFDEIQAGDHLWISFPPRGGMSDNWTIEHSRTAIAYELVNADTPMLSYWVTGDGQTLVSKLDDRAKIELLARL